MNNDDIRSKVLETATEFSIRHPNEGIKTEIFEDLFEQELEKFTYFKDTMSGNERRQSGLLEEITKTNEAFLNSRKSDPITKQREQVLQRLDVALSKHQEILVNLSEALQFYQDFAKLLDQLRATVREVSLSTLGQRFGVSPLTVTDFGGTALRAQRDLLPSGSMQGEQRRR